MISTPSPDVVLSDLGDKVLGALLDAVDQARTDLDEFREWRPAWHSTFTNRFTANFLHERVWATLVENLHDLDNVEVVDREPQRQFHTTKYVVRIKRHRPGDRISSYPTHGALRFWSSQVTLPGLEQASLAMGYQWDADLRRVGDAVVSFRDELDKPVWAVVVRRSSAGGVPITWTPVDPELPELDLSSVLDGTAAEEGS